MVSLLLGWCPFLCSFVGFAVLTRNEALRQKRVRRVRILFYPLIGMVMGVSKMTVVAHHLLVPNELACSTSREPLTALLEVIAPAQILQKIWEQC